MGKRANNRSPQRNTKKAKAEPKADPAFASVGDAIMESEQVPQRVRDMLIEMLPFSLKFASDERHDLQSMAVDMIEQTLTGKKAALVENVAKEDEGLATLKGSESGLAAAVTEAEENLKNAKEVALAKATALANAMEEENASQKNLNSLRTAQTEADSKFGSMKTEKEEINAAVAEHYGPIEEGEDGKAHYKKLEPFLVKIDIESTLLKALPSTCAKKKDARGAFDNIVIKSLKDAFHAKVEALGASIEAEGPASESRAAGVQAAEADLEAKKAAKEKAGTDAEEASKGEKDCKAALTKAKKDEKDFHPKVDANTKRLEKAREVLADFEAGSFANFFTFKSRVAAVPEEAPAPAEEAAAEEAPAAPAEEPAAEVTAE